MIEPWFSAQVAPFWAFLSLFSLAATLDPFIVRGLYRRAITGAMGIGATVGVTLLVAGGAACFLRQPGYVSFPLLFGGSIVAVAHVSVLIVLPGRYTAAEMRRIAACDM